MTDFDQVRKDGTRVSHDQEKPTNRAGSDKLIRPGRATDPTERDPEGNLMRPGRAMPEGAGPDDLMRPGRPTHGEPGSDDLMRPGR